MDDHISTGRYIKQLEGYSAFIPNPLSPPLSITIDDEMQALLSKADRALGRLDGSIQALPNPDLFVFMYVRKEAVLSSQIEGTQASIGDLLEVEAKIFDPLKPNDVAEVLNYVAALNYGLDRLNELPFSLRLIREIHEQLMQGVRGHHLTPGEFRKSQNWIGPTGATIGEASFVPPPPHELGGLLSDFEGYLHSDSYIPSLLKIGIAHAQFETIHPFLDGNGRVGRLLITFLLCQQEILIKPVLYLSHYLKKHRQTYYDLLQGTRDNGDWESWLKFFLVGVSEVSNEATETARKIVAMREEHRSIIIDEFSRSAANALKALEQLYSHPIVSVNEVEQTLGITYQVANSLVERLVEQGLLVEITGQRRNRKYGYQQYIRLFTE